MKEIESLQIPENTFSFTDKELCVLNALIFYAPEGMTKEAEKIREKMQERLQLHKSIGSFNVWM